MVNRSLDYLVQLDESNTKYFSIDRAARSFGVDAHTLPRSIRTLLEGILRHSSHDLVEADHVAAVVRNETGATIPYFPGRILLQDASGLPVLADLLTLSDRARSQRTGAAEVQPTIPMDLVVDHALEVDESGSTSATLTNLNFEYERHEDRYHFLAQAQSLINGLRVVPPGVGICHQLNLEVFATLARTEEVQGESVAALDTLVGTDSHTTMINGLSVTGWGVGGIEATSAALGHPIMMPLPRVVGVHLSGKLNAGVFAADLALHLAQLLRDHGVVGSFVEFHGPGAASLPVPDRATVSNMAPEYGATMAWFPADPMTIAYLRATGRNHTETDFAENYLKAQGLFHDSNQPEPHFDEVVHLDLGTVERTIAGPARPHDALSPSAVPNSRSTTPSRDASLDGAVVIASITSCTNTSNPRSLVAAGLLAQNAVAAGLRVPEWVKTSFTPGSQAAADLLTDADLQDSLDTLGFAVTGFGCGTCMGNSGPLLPGISEKAKEEGSSLAAVLSGNRNFAGRIHPEVASSYLGSPAMVVAFALLGHVRADVTDTPLGRNTEGREILLADIWPSEEQINEVVDTYANSALGGSSSRVLTNPRWEILRRRAGSSVAWQEETGTIRRPPFTDEPLTEPIILGDVKQARALLVLGDAVTTDHISPVSRILPESAAGRWLLERGVDRDHLGTFSSRRLNHEVMLRGGFANHRLENFLCPGAPGGHTLALDGVTVVPVHEAASELSRARIPSVILAGKLYGAGSARDWAAKVTRLLGVSAIIAEGFERIHRTNLTAMGVLPIEASALSEFNRHTIESVDILGLGDGPPTATHQKVRLRLTQSDGHVAEVAGICRLDTPIEVSWVRQGGVFPYLMREVFSN